jgi:hypothetical protein
MEGGTARGRMAGLVVPDAGEGAVAQPWSSTASATAVRTEKGNARMAAIFSGVPRRRQRRLRHARADAAHIHVPFRAGLAGCRRNRRGAMAARLQFLKF